MSNSVEDLRQHTMLEGYREDDRVVEWFFAILAELSAEDLAHFIHFWTGEPKVMREGFENAGMSINSSK